MAQSEAIYAAVSGSTNGDNTLVAATSGAKIRVLALALTAAGAVNVRLESGAGGTAMTGVMVLAAAGSQIVLPYNPLGWCETAASALLNLELSSGVAVTGTLVYATVT